jgi:hypothetical protein
MVRRATTVLLAALGAACASAVGFTEAPSAVQLAALGGACVIAAALQMVDSRSAALVGQSRANSGQKKS